MTWYLWVVVALVVVVLAAVAVNLRDVVRYLRIRRM